MGLDLGQAADYTALCVLERIWENGKDGRFDVRHLQRFALGTPYPTIVENVAKMCEANPLKDNYTLIADSTGVGAPVADLLTAKGLRLVEVTITGGDDVSSEGDKYRVPKRDLVTMLQVLLQNQTLKFAENLPEVPMLINEMLAFQVKINPLTAHDSYGAWREGAHDDLVLSVALAVWYAKRQMPPPTSALSLAIIQNRAGDCNKSRRHYADSKRNRNRNSETQSATCRC